MDLHSKDQSDGELQIIEMMSPSTDDEKFKDRYFIVSKGSSFNLLVQGGQNIFDDFLEDYVMTWTVSMINGTKDDRLVIKTVE